MPQIFKETCRDFIHKALYANEYGYFQRNANIFHTPEPIQFTNIKDLDDYAKKLNLLYKNQSKNEEYYQLWHTPSELFRPWYGNAIAKYIIQEYEISKRKEKEELVIMEIGPGNGTLCHDITTFIENYNFFNRNKENFQSINYQYHLVEISKKLHKLQKTKFSLNSRIFCHLNSILDWNPPNFNSIFSNFSNLKVERGEIAKKNEMERQDDSKEEKRVIKPWIIAMEVLDNMPHDRIMYDRNGNLLQGWVNTNLMSRYGQSFGRFHETYEYSHGNFIKKENVAITDRNGNGNEIVTNRTVNQSHDPYLLEAIRILDSINHDFPSTKCTLSDYIFKMIDSMKIRTSKEGNEMREEVNNLWDDPWKKEFIPTFSIILMKKLANLWPQSRLIISDFGMELPGRIAGWSSPRVQTRYKGDTISCSTYLLQPGLFDIFFPTDFKLLGKIHDFLFANGNGGKGSGGERRAKIMKHGEFLEKYADYQNTATQSGFNPLLEDFENVYFLLS